MSLQKDPSRKPNKRKFRELILFMAERSEGDRPFGATKLNKLLFYSDFLAYLTLGKAITWQPYQKLENGPAPRRLLPIASEMEREEAIAYSERDYYGKRQRRMVALRTPDLLVFSGPEVQLINDVLEEFWGKSASEMSAISHDFIGWELAEMGEDIPYEVALVTCREPPEEYIKEGLKLESVAKECLRRNGH